MPTELNLLLLTAASIGFFHTLIGPDHYLPFIMMAKAGQWTYRKTLLVTFWCGIGHVAGSIILGFIGIAIGVALNRLEFIEALRGDIAVWILIAFGLVYMTWGLRKALRNQPHKHHHTHADGKLHTHEHTHHDAHAHAHEKKASVTPWMLFVIFVLGPCEPLIPLLMYPAAMHNTAGILAVSLVFGVATVGTMLGIVALAYAGLKPVRASFVEKYMHAIAGFTIMLCGLAIQFLGL
ncbi:MAG: sulfite exporter TauE/SafE family protein [Bacteroidales bacterium]|nr:sulfite exporter TauE/SafE family protein [Bacteroidales bacterium]MDZ4203804.1 sulfite exporter TauE/SafE family protein [Bacteroidales bacterium]